MKKNFGPNKASYFLIVFNSLQEEILQISHDGLTAGHINFHVPSAELKADITGPVYPSMSRTMSSCHECQHRKTPSTRPAEFLQPTRTPLRAFQQIGMDVFGIFPTSSGNKRIIVATDYLI